MIKPEVLDALLAAGATAEMIVAAVKADLATEEARKKSKRANNAERQRRFKQKTKAVTDDNAGNALPSVTPLSLPLSPQTPQTPTHTPGDNTRARKGGLPAKPEGVEPQTWSDFLELRKGKRAPLTETALSGIKREADKAGWSLEAALAKCLARGWQGFEAEWVANEPKPVASNDVDPLMRSILARKARELSG